MIRADKRIIALIFVVLGLVLINIRLGSALLGTELPKIIVIMGLSLPLIISFIVLLVVFCKIYDSRKSFR